VVYELISDNYFCRAARVVDVDQPDCSTSECRPLTGDSTPNRNGRGLHADHGRIRRCAHSAFPAAVRRYCWLRLFGLSG
jgi:hypothetical protein